MFVRDTAKADWTLVGCEICPEASRNVDRRLALYRVASMNYMVSNGPCTLALYSPDIPYICFMKSCKELDLNGDENWFEMFQGLPRGDQWPWAGDQQRMIWETSPADSGRMARCEDTFEAIMDAAGLVADQQRKTA